MLTDKWDLVISGGAVVAYDRSFKNTVREIRSLVRHLTSTLTSILI